MTLTTSSEPSSSKPLTRSRFLSFRLTEPDCPQNIKQHVTRSFITHAAVLNYSQFQYLRTVSRRNHDVMKRVKCFAPNCALIFASCAILLAVFYYLTYKSREENENRGLFRVIPPELTSPRPEADTDPTLLFNLHFEYAVNSAPCEPNVTSVILVTSYFGNVETRSSMRRAFSTEKLRGFKMRRVFLLGLAPRDKYTRQAAIEDENARFGDLVQGNFLEAYRNLTFKHVMGHRWASENCKDVKYVMKMDDDIVVNIYKLTKLLENFTLPENHLAGYILKGLVPIREPANKWYVPHTEYPDSNYPPFLSGWFYITTPSVSRKITDLHHKTPYFWIDDLYVTGTIAKKLGLGHTDIGSRFTVHPEFLRCCINDLREHGYDCEVMVGPNGADAELFFEFNAAMRRCYEEKCSKRPKGLNETCVAERKFGLGRGDAVVESYRLF